METTTTPNAGTRIAAMLLDHAVMTFIVMVFFIPGMLSDFSTAFDVTHDPIGADLFGGISYVGLIGVALYFCKDCLNGRSPAKRALKLQVVEQATDRVASPIRCFVRNIFCMIWPIEVMVTLVNPSRRLGDMVAGTKVVSFSPDREQPSIAYVQVGLSVVLAYGLMVLVVLPFGELIDNQDGTRVAVVDHTLNEEKAMAVEQLFTDSLPTYLTPDVQVYDQIKDHPNLAYVSVIFRLNENYLENDDSYETLQSITVPLLLSVFPEETFVGQIQYVYQQAGSIRTRALTFDWRSSE